MQKKPKCAKCHSKNLEITGPHGVGAEPEIPENLAKGPRSYKCKSCGNEGKIN